MLPNLELLKFLHPLHRRANGAKQWKRKIKKKTAHRGKEYFYDSSIAAQKGSVLFIKEIKL